jgi:DNA-binding Lrp family transcriptional regulator
VDKVLTVRAILHIFVEPEKIEDIGEALAKMPEIIDVYEVTGYCQIGIISPLPILTRLYTIATAVASSRNHLSILFLFPEVSWK